MALEISSVEAARLNSALQRNEKYSTESGRKVWTEERELKIVELLKSGKSVCSIVREEKVSGRKIIEIRKKYHIWGA